MPASVASSSMATACIAMGMALASPIHQHAYAAMASGWAQYWSGTTCAHCSSAAMPRSTRTQSGLDCGLSNASVSMRLIASPLARVCGCTANSMISSQLHWSAPMMSAMINASRIANESVTVTASSHNACASQSNSSNRGSSIHVRHVSNTGSNHSRDACATPSSRRCCLNRSSSASHASSSRSSTSRSLRGSRGVAVTRMPNSLISMVCLAFRLLAGRSPRVAPLPRVTPLSPIPSLLVHLDRPLWSDAPSIHIFRGRTPPGAMPRRPSNQPRQCRNTVRE